MNVVGVINVIAGVVGFIGIGWLVVIAMQGNPERRAEDDARAFFDRHGHWPDDR